MLGLHRGVRTAGNQLSPLCRSRELATSKRRPSNQHPQPAYWAVPTVVKRSPSRGRDRPADQFLTVMLTWELKALPPGPKASDNSA